MADERICFVISPIGDVGSEIRRRADQVLKYVIEPACSKCGYVALRADKISTPGNITSQVIQQVLEAPLVIADLTGSNGNVFYELAIRHAIKKPLVQLISEGEEIPFDVANMRTVFLNHRDLDSVSEAVQEIEKHIRATENQRPEEIETPITVAIDFQSLRQSGDPEQRSIAEFAKQIAEIRAELRDIKVSVRRELPKIADYQFEQLRNDFIHSRAATRDELLDYFKQQLLSLKDVTQQHTPAD